MDDQKIIELIRSGSNDLALNALYRKFPAVQKMIRTGGGSRKDAEDIFQESLIIFLNKARNPDFQLTARLSTYLYAVCRYLWSDRLRKGKQYVHHDDAELAGLSPAETADLDDSLRQETRLRLAEQTLNELKDRCRELLLLFYTQQLTLAAIAVKMGYGSENSTKNQKYKCIEAARTRLKELEKQQLQNQ